VRSLVIPSLENIVTWHERDLTQSSAERFITPEACILVDYMLYMMNTVISGLRVDEQRMLKNIELTQGRTMSEAVMTALVKKGVDRQEAHELLRRLAIRSDIERRPFREVLLHDRLVSRRLNREEIDHALNPRNYLGTAIKQVELVAAKKG
jgi:adenylosuccinate lyase